MRDIAGGIEKSKRVFHLTQAHPKLVFAICIYDVIDKTIIKTEITLIRLASPAGQYLSRNQPVRICPPRQIRTDFTQTCRDIVITIATDIVVAGVNQTLAKETMRLQALPKLHCLCKSTQQDKAERNKRLTELK
jgi:hypothetical protein